jgi:hypothetical protein
LCFVIDPLPRVVRLATSRTPCRACKRNNKIALSKIEKICGHLVFLL